MRFVFLMAFSRIKKNIGQYLMVALQIALGAGILYAALAMWFSAQAQFNAIRRSVENGVVRLQGLHEDISLSGGEITPADYSGITKDLPPENMNVSYEERFTITAHAQGAEHNIPILLVSEHYYRDLMGMPGPGRVYVGKNAAPLLADPAFAPGEWNKAYWDAESRSLLGVPVEFFVPLEGNRFANTSGNATFAKIAESFTGELAAWTYDDAVIFPLSLAGGYAGAGSAALYVTINAASPDATERYCNQIVAWLAEKHPGVRYSYDNPFESVESGYRAQASSARLMAVAALGLLGILLFGFSGLLVLLVNKRKAALAVSRMCGARPRRLAAELFTEVALVVFAGATPGLLLSSLCVPMLGGWIIQAQNSWPAALVCLLGLLGVCALVSAAGVFKAVRAAPATVLHAL